jgi:hypothetical protein
MISSFPSPAKNFYPNVSFSQGQSFCPLGGGEGEPSLAPHGYATAVMGMANVFEFYSMDGAFDNFLSF